MAISAAKHPKRFDGLLQHWQRYAGEFRGVEPRDVRGYNRGYDIAFYESGDGAMVTAGTNGLRFQRYVTLKEEELACSVHAHQGEAARYLVDVTASLVLEKERGLQYGDVFGNSQPLLAGTQIYGVLGAPHPYLDEGFDLFRAADGEILLQIVTLIPVTRAEIDFIAAHGYEKLGAIWQEHGTDLLDVERGSPI